MNNSFRPQEHPRADNGKFRPTEHRESDVTLGAPLVPTWVHQITSDDLYAAAGTGDSHKQYELSQKFLQQNRGKTFSGNEADMWLEYIEETGWDDQGWAFRGEINDNILGMAIARDKEVMREHRRNGNRDYTKTSDDPRSLPALQLRPADFQGRFSGVPEAPPTGFFDDDDHVDLAVDTVMDGPLSRGAVNKQRREAFAAWHQFALDTEAKTGEVEFTDFAAGMEQALDTLYDGHVDDDMELGEALAVTGKKRTTAQTRENWRLQLQHAENGDHYRGHLAAGLILSGADEYWNLRSTPGVTVKGRVPHTDKA